MVMTEADIQRIMETMQANQGDLAGGVSCLEAAAGRGHAAAALKLGDCFEQGLGAPRSAELAAYWYRKAAAGGEKRAYAALLNLARRRR